MIGRFITSQQAAFTSASVGATTALGAQTQYVRLVASAACHVVFGSGAQTATTAGAFLPANIPETVKVSPGQFVAAIRAPTSGLVTSSDGILSITELSG